jgi:hypothetical protein
MYMDWGAKQIDTNSVAQDKLRLQEADIMNAVDPANRDAHHQNRAGDLPARQLKGHI